MLASLGKLIISYVPDTFIHCGVFGLPTDICCCTLLRAQHLSFLYDVLLMEFPFCNTHFSVDFLELLILFLFSGFCFVFCFGDGCFYFLGGWSFSGAGYEPQGYILAKQAWAILLNYTPASIVTTSALRNLMVSFIMSFRILHIGSPHLHV